MSDCISFPLSTWFHSPPRRPWRGGFKMETVLVRLRRLTLMTASSFQAVVTQQKKMKINSVVLKPVTFCIPGLFFVSRSRLPALCFPQAMRDTMRWFTGWECEFWIVQVARIGLSDIVDYAGSRDLRGPRIPSTRMAYTLCRLCVGKREGSATHLSFHHALNHSKRVLLFRSCSVARKPFIVWSNFNTPFRFLFKLNKKRDPGSLEAWTRF